MSLFEDEVLPALCRELWLATRYTTVPEGQRITFALDAAVKTRVANDNSAIVAFATCTLRELGARSVGESASGSSGVAWSTGGS